VLFQNAQLSSSEFAKAKHNPSVSVTRWTLHSPMARIIYERRTPPRLLPRSWTNCTIWATGVQIWVRDELPCAREFDLSHSGWLLRNRRTLYRCVGEGGSWVVGAMLPEAEKCYNFRLAMPSSKAAYCVSQGQPTLLLVVHQDSQVVCAAVHKNSHLIQNFNPSLP
jgi:hypothetical protein